MVQRKVLHTTQVVLRSHHTATTMPIISASDNDSDEAPQHTMTRMYSFVSVSPNAVHSHKVTYNRGERQLGTEQNAPVHISTRTRDIRAAQKVESILAH